MKIIKMTQLGSYIIILVMVGGVVYEIVRPDSLPQDISDSHVVLYGVTDSTASTLGVSGRWPATELISTPQLNNQGNSYYEVQRIIKNGPPTPRG